MPPELVTFYANLWAEQVAQYAQYGELYGWLAVASLIVAVLALALALLRRADGIQAAGLMGQHFVVFALPFIIGLFLASPA